LSFGSTSFSFSEVSLQQTTATELAHNFPVTQSNWRCNETGRAYCEETHLTPERKRLRPPRVRSRRTISSAKVAVF